MQNLEMVCPNLKELEGVAQEPFLENHGFVQRNNKSLASQFGQMERASSLPFFLYLLHSIFGLFNVMPNSMFLLCFVVVFVCHEEIF